MPAWSLKSLPTDRGHFCEDVFDKFIWSADDSVVLLLLEIAKIIVHVYQPGLPQQGAKNERSRTPRKQGATPAN